MTLQYGIGYIEIDFQFNMAVKIYVPYPDALGSDNDVMLMGLKQKRETGNPIVNSDIVVILSSYKNYRE